MEKRYENEGVALQENCFLEEGDVSFNGYYQYTYFDVYVADEVISFDKNDFIKYKRKFETICKMFEEMEKEMNKGADKYPII